MPELTFLILRPSIDTVVTSQGRRLMDPTPTLQGEHPHVHTAYKALPAIMNKAHANPVQSPGLNLQLMH